MSFDALAPHYRWLEFVLAGPKLQRCRTAFLGQVTRCRNVLILGEGNGRFIAECRKRLRGARITCVDASARMLQLARSRLQRQGIRLEDIQFVQADALAWPAPKQAFDLVVTHFFLDCFRPDQLRELVTKLAGAAQPDATWLLADFQIPPAGIRRYRALAIHRLMYFFFALATGLPARKLTVPDGVLVEHRFVLRERRLSEWDLLHTDRWERGAGGPL